MSTPPSNRPRSDFLRRLDDVFYGNKTLELKVVAWRQFLHGASRANKGCIDDHRIELHCRLQHALQEGEITIGESELENLRDANCLIEIRSAQKVFADFESENPGSEDGKDVQGVLHYSDAANSTDHFIAPPRGAHDASQTIKGWIYFGVDTVREISRLLTLQPEYEIHIGITVKATAAPTPNSLTYKPSGHHRITYHWDAREWLGITKAVLIVGKAPVTLPETSTGPNKDRPWWKIARRGRRAQGATISESRQELQRRAADDFEG